MADRNLVRANVGSINIIGCPLIWTSASGGSQQSNRGEAIFNPATGSKQRLFDEPEFENLVFGTAYSTTYAQLLDKWYQANKYKSDIVAVSQINDIFYRFTNCSIVANADFPGFSKDGDTGTTAKRLQLTLAPGGRAPL